MISLNCESHTGVAILKTSNEINHNNIYYVRRIITLALPLSGSRSLAMINTFISVLILAKLNHFALAASGLITTSQMTITMISMAILLSIGVVVSQQIPGLHREFIIGGIIQQGWLLGIIITIPSMLIIYNISHLLLLLKQPIDVIKITQDYFKGYIWGMPAVALLTVNSQFIYGIIAKQRIIILMNIICMVVFTILAYGLVLGHFGFPAMGAVGLGYACAIKLWLNLLLFTIYFILNKDFQPYALFKFRFIKTRHMLNKLFNIGWPISIHTAGEIFSVFVLTIMIGWIGVNALAINQIISQYALLLIIPMFGLAQASGILVSQSAGEKKLGNIKKYGSNSILIALSIAIIGLFIFLIFPNFFVNLFVKQDMSSHISRELLVVNLVILAAIGQCFDAIQTICIGSLRGLYDTKIPMLLSILSMWFISIPFGFVLAFKLNLGIYGLIEARVITMMIGAIIFYTRWKIKSTDIINNIKNTELHLNTQELPHTVS